MPSNPDRRLKLTVSTQTLYDPNLTQSYKLTVIASDGNLMPDEIFLFLYVDPVPGYPDGRNDFKGVCSPAQLATLPVDEPAEDSVDNYYRTASLSLTYNTDAEATEAWAAILDAVTTLKSALDFSDGLTTTTYWIGTPQ